MIQRKQTLFLIAAAVLLLVGALEMSTTFATAGEGIRLATLSNFALSDGKSSNSLYAVMGIMLFVVAALSVVTIFLFHRRKLQMRLCWWMMFILLIYYITRMSCIISIAKYLNLKPQFDFYDAFPLMALIMIVFAYRGILHDERLVRSSYRIR